MTSIQNEDLLEDAYVGKRIYDLLETLTSQISVVYTDRGILIPVHTSSTLHCLSVRKGMSLADIARTLGIPHQLARQRMDKLLALGLIEKTADPKDGRRFQWHLTAAGNRQADLLRQCMKDVITVHECMDKELGFVLAEVLTLARAALIESPMSERFAGLEKERAA